MTFLRKLRDSALTPAQRPTDKMFRGISQVVPPVRERPVVPPSMVKAIEKLKGKIPTMKKGGIVKKTGIHLLHQGEMVLPSVVAQHMKKMMAKK